MLKPLYPSVPGARLTALKVLASRYRERLQTQPAMKAKQGEP